MGGAGAALILYGILSVLPSEAVLAASPVQFYFVSQHLSQADAKTYCRQKYTDLATFHNVQEMQAAMEAVGSSDSDVLWIGLERQTSEKFIWSYDNTNFYQPGEAEYRNWDVNEPSGMNEKCVEMRTNAKFNDYLCSVGQAFICYNKSSTDQYVTIYDAMSWPVAQRYCRDHYVDLASVRNPEENSQLVRGQNVWIGLYVDSWGWSDQDGSTFRQWVLGQPDNYGGVENCVVLSIAAGGRWHDISCDLTFPFICYGDPLIQKFTLRMKLLSSHDLLDPNVKSKVPQQIKSALNVSGLMDVKLHWTEAEDPHSQDVLSTSEDAC